MKRLQGAIYHKRKKWLKPIGFSITKVGNVCVYYKGDSYHYLNNAEKESFNTKGLKKFSEEEVEEMLARKTTPTELIKKKGVTV